MSCQDIDHRRAIYDEWARGNFCAGLDLYDPHMVLIQRPGFPESGAYVGTKAIAGYMREFLTPGPR